MQLLNWQLLLGCEKYHGLVCCSFGHDEKIFLIADNRKNVLNSWLPCYGCDKLSYNFWFRAILSGFSNI
jgi:hypothetical protein